MVFRVALAPAEVCPPVTIPEVDVAIDAAATWAIDNLGEDGRFLYRYDRQADTWWTSYNLPRHAGMSTALFQAVAAGHGEYLGAADDTLGYMLDNLLEYDDWVRSPRRIVRSRSDRPP